MSVLTVRRHVTNWGFAVAVLMDTDADQRWNIIDAYGEMSDLDTPWYTDDQVSRWTTVYDSAAWAPVSTTGALDVGSIKRCDEGIIAVKLSQPEGSPSWLVLMRGAGSVDLVDDEHVADWDTVYAAESSEDWSERHGINPRPSGKSEIISWH